MFDVLSGLGLEGHDSELFSFLDQPYLEQLRGHEAARQPLWTFGSARHGKLQSVTYWNGFGCLAFSAFPTQARRESDRYWNVGGCVTQDDLLAVEALTLIRLLFVNSYTAMLGGRPWIDRQSDPTLQRLHYLRGWFGKSTACIEWAGLKAAYFDWALTALERLGTGTMRKSELKERTTLG